MISLLGKPLSKNFFALGKVKYLLIQQFGGESAN